jgi:glycosyltransferase involved in cell wall biosynthesis
MKVVICWSHISGYMASCWRALAAERDVDFSILAFQSSSGETINFDDSLMLGLQARLLTNAEQADADLVRSLVVQHKPDIVVIPGWFHEPYVKLTRDPELARAKFVMTMDTPRRDTLRQKLGRFVIGSLLRRIDRVVVAGERAFQLARLLGVPERKILRGVYGFDEPLFAAVRERRNTLAWPRRFLYVGRYVEDKAIDVMAEGYRRYRAQVSNPWTLTCCGKGPLAHLLKADGIDDRGFVEPAALPAVLAEHGAFVLASRYEPWGVAIAEALCSGMPVICTEACGASVELVRPYFNGLTVATDDADALAGALRWAQEHESLLPAMGAAGPGIAAAFAASVWARRWREMFAELMCTPTEPAHAAR